MCLLYRLDKVTVFLILTKNNHGRAMRLLESFRSIWRKRGELPLPSDVHQEMTQWLNSPLGQALLQSEAAILEPILERIFGYHFLQLGVSEHSMLAPSPIGHKLMFLPQWAPKNPHVVASNEALPLQSESVDAVLIHHALEYTPDNHRLLREASRVLMPGGKLLIVGFNPLSSWGMRNACRWRNTAPWDARYITSSRVQDWLKLLEFSVDKVEHGAYLLPFAHNKVVGAAPRFETMGQKFKAPLGAIYVIVACKQVMPVTPIMPRWPKLPRPVLVRPVNETARTRSQVAKVKTNS